MRNLADLHYTQTPRWSRKAEGNASVSTDKNPSRSHPPTLMAADKAKTGEETHRILASLDGRSAPPQSGEAQPQKKYLTFGLAGLVAAAGLAWFTISTNKPADAPIAAKSTSLPKIAANNPATPAVVAAKPAEPFAAVPPLVSSSASTADKTTESAAKPSAPAIITNDIPAAKPAPSAPVEKPVVLAEAKPAKAPTVKTVKPVVSQPKVAAVAAPKIVDAPKVAAAPAPPVKLAMADPDELNTTMKMRGVVQPPRPVQQGEVIYSTPPAATSNSASPAPASKNKRDADVDMLTAMMVYSERQEVIVVPAANAPRANAKREAADKKNKAPTTATLLGQCQALGWLEGELCRLRVCENRWGLDPACPGSPPNQSAAIPSNQTVYTNKP
jgi:hypothetical protein